MNKKAILKLSDIHLRFKTQGHEVNILKGIDLEITSGRSLAILGPSGSGKSSLLSIMSGLERQTKGRVEVAGQDFKGLNEDALALFRRDNIGIVLQSFHLIPTMNAIENVAVPLELAGRRDAFERAKEILDLVGLSHRLNHYPAQLSGGEQQRVAIARALAPEPKILFADEPTGNLDGETGHKIIDLIFSLQETIETTLILITHDIEIAERCERVLHIHDGLIVEDKKIIPKQRMAE